MIKAIQTKYAGRIFRSRLEARYAVMFDALKIKWEYEFEGFKLSNGEWYLPDFWLPKFNGGMFVEVKPEQFSDAEKNRCWLLCKETKMDVWLAAGTPDIMPWEVYYWNDQPPFVIEGDGIPNADQAEHENRMFAMCGYGDIGKPISKVYVDCLGDTFINAVRAANEARFEHGETPNP